MIQLFLIAAAAVSSCHPLAGEKILAGDLAAVDGRFSALPADAPIGYAPAPGAKRFLHVAEQVHLAARYKLAETAFEEICFERPLHHLTAEQMLAAMQASLGMPDAHIEVKELSLYAAPEGQLVFPRVGLGMPAATQPDAPVLWRGYVLYGEKRHFNVWARVKIQAKGPRVVATEFLRPGGIVQPSQVKLETWEGFPETEAPLGSLELIVGHTVKRAVRAGASVPWSALEETGKDILHGERVNVEVRNGAARLQFDAQAEADAKVGDNVLLRNPHSGKTFTAQVTGKSKALVTGPDLVTGQNP